MARNEISLSDLPSELISKILSYLSSYGYSSLLTMNSKFYAQTLPLLQQKAYSSRIIARTFTFLNPKIYAGLLSCLYKPEWDLGALRLFVIDYCDLIKVLKSVQDPSDEGFESVSTCFLDYLDLVDVDGVRLGESVENSGTAIASNTFTAGNIENNGGDENTQDTLNYENIHNTANTNEINDENTKNNMTSSILRYSERMDLGTFLVQINLPSKTLLLRCKPVGKSRKDQLYGDGKLVVWDEYSFGRCEVCNVKLSRLQVCEACKVVYYCSLECQRKDWKNHKLDCESLGFYV